MLSAVAFLAKAFGRGSSWQNGADDALGHLGEVELETSVSVGFSVFPIDAEEFRPLLKEADAAMYESKKRLLTSIKS
jgi:GGDEF domain-containing protein